MNAVHIRTTGFYCKACPLVVERAIGSLPGVADVVAVRSMDLTSVLYDPTITDAETLCSRIRAAGFGAAVYRPDADVRSDATEPLACAECGTSRREGRSRYVRAL
jgi:copper chaperone CopZ